MHNEAAVLVPRFEDIFGLAYQSAAIGYYFWREKDHMSTPVIADEAARNTCKKKGVEIIEKLVERMDMNHIIRTDEGIGAL